MLWFKWGSQATTRMIVFHREISGQMIASKSLLQSEVNKRSWESSHTVSFKSSEWQGSREFDGSSSSTDRDHPKGYVPERCRLYSRLGASVCSSRQAYLDVA